MLAGKRAEDGVSGCTRGSDASGPGLHEAGLCGSHRDRRGRGRLNAGVGYLYCEGLDWSPSRLTTSLPLCQLIATCAETRDRPSPSAHS